MRCAVWALALAAFGGGLVGGTVCGQLRNLAQTSAPRALPPDMVVATGHGPSGLETETLTPVEAPATAPASAPAATAPAAAPPTPPARLIIRRGPIMIQGGIVLQGGGLPQGAVTVTSLPTMKLGDVASFVPRGGRLWVDVQLPGPKDLRYKPVNMEGFDGPTLVQFTESGGVMNFALIVRQLEPKALGFLLTLTRSELRIRMAPAGQGVELIQQMKGTELGEVSEDGGAVVLNVWPDAQFSGSPAQTFRAADWRHLRVQEAAAFRKYLRPVLAKLGAARAALPDAGEAVQILAAGLPVDDATQKKFAEILVRLDADTLEERDAASKSLQALGWRGAIAAQKLDLKTLTVEQRVRVRRFLAPYTYMDDKEVERSRQDADLLVDCLALEDPALVKAAAAQLEALTKKKIAVDADMPADKRLGLLDQWRAAVNEK